jgi:O-antigen ligase
MNTQRVGADGHSMLLVMLIITRCLIWSGDATAWDNLLWLWLVIIANGFYLWDVWRGRIVDCHFGVSGLCAGLFLLCLFPAALSAPYQATGIGLWGMAVIHLWFAYYLFQVARGRERLIFSALCTGLALQCLTALAQWLWVFPAMKQALTQGNADLLAAENAHGDLAERLANGGLFGTFTLANTLAAFLLLAALPLFSLVRQLSVTARLLVFFLLFLSAVVAYGTASKGALCAVVGAAAISYALHGPVRWRFVPLLGCVVAGITVWFTPALYAIIDPSVSVRAGYWSGAWDLWWQKPIFGQGLTAFQAYGTAAMPLTAEHSRYVHNELLEILLSGGIIAALALIAWWWSQLRTAHAPTNMCATDIPSRAVWSATWPLFIAFLFFAALGMLSSNTMWWPAGGDDTWWLWPLIFAGIASVVMLFAVRLPLPKPWACQLALLAFFLHCLIDFNLHSPALWGALILVSILAAPRQWTWPITMPHRVIISALFILLCGGLWFGTQRAVRLGMAAGQLSAENSAENNNDRQRLSASQWQLAQEWPVDPTLALSAARNAPFTGESLALLRSINAAFPWDGQIQEIYAQHLFIRGFYAEAISRMNAAVATNPALIPLRKRFVTLLEQALVKQPNNDAWQALLSEQRQFIATWSERVYLRNR